MWIRIRKLMFLTVICAALARAATAQEDDCFKAGIRCYVPPSGGIPISGEFRLNQFGVPPVMPTSTTFPVKVSFTRTKGNANAVISANVIGDWRPEEGWNLGDVRMLDVGSTVECVVEITTPSRPGTYRLRLFLRQDFSPTPTFWGKSDHVWSETIIRVVEGR